jgi:hypothetical protein
MELVMPVRIKKTPLSRDLIRRLLEAAKRHENLKLDLFYMQSGECSREEERNQEDKVEQSSDAFEQVLFLWLTEVTKESK